jgi:hypothetical protein
MHMVLTYHRADYQKLPDEDKVLAALRPLRIPPGDYMFPHATSMAAMKDPAFMEKLNAGPCAFMTVRPTGAPSMGGSLVLWFLSSVLVSVFAAYIAGHALAAGAPYLSVFRFTGTVAFAGYALAHLQESIWMSRNWGTTIRHVVDGLVYALLTAGAFGWLWPEM